MTSATEVLRVGVDATPMLGSRTGIGHYTAALVRGLAARADLAVTAVPFTARGGAAPTDLPAGVRWRHRPLPARGLQEAWARTGFPPVELLAGRVDVFHGTNFVLPPTRRAAGVLTVHDLAFLRYPELVDTASLRYRTLVPRGIQRADAVLTPSRAVADELVDTYRLHPDAVTVTPLGVDPSWLDMATPTPADRARWGLPSKYFLAVGTLEPRKGLDVLVAAYRILLRSAPRIPPLVLVGATGWGADLDVSDLGPDRIVRPGYIAYRDLQRVVGGASVFAFPSRYEGFGLPPLEAMACGIPVVASDIPTSREVLGGFAALPPVGDPEALAAALLAAWDDPPGAGEVVAARRHAATWTWQRCVENTVAAYRRVAS
ncbi:MAG: glycosyltransferase family 1 protein [Nakamurella sp.]